MNTATGAAVIGAGFRGAVPLEVTATRDREPCIEVDQHSITVCRYEYGLSKMEIRWCTFTDPWTFQPQPQCGFVVVGTHGTLSSYDYARCITVQTREQREPFPHLADELPSDQNNPVAYLLECLKDDCEIEGPLAPHVSLICQRIVDTAYASAEAGRTLTLVG